MSTCPKCQRPVNEGNSPNAEECHETDDDEGLCAAYAKIARLEKELAEQSDFSASILSKAAEYKTEVDKQVRHRLRAEEIVCAVIDATPLQAGKDLAASIHALRAERDKLLGFYTEIVKELDDDLVLKCINDITNEASIRSDEAAGLAGQLKDARAALDIALSALKDIRTYAHCLAKAGPLNTPTLDKAWSRFMEIDAKAANAIGQVRAARDI